jgi:putative methanogenesis marker domain 9
MTGLEDAPKHICRGGDPRGLAFCCPPIKPCPIHKVLSYLGLSSDEFTKLKLDFASKTKLKYGSNTCFGSLVWCCKIMKPCYLRDSELLRYGISPEEYMSLKKELSEYIIKNSPLFKEYFKKYLNQGYSKEESEKLAFESVIKNYKID